MAFAGGYQLSVEGTVMSGCASQALDRIVRLRHFSGAFGWRLSFTDRRLF